MKVTVVDSVREAASADIVVAATPARGPVVFKEHIKPGTHINAIGADAEGKEELSPRILKRAKVIVDDILQASHSGEINVPLKAGLITTEDIFTELGKAVIGLKVRTSDKDITVYDSTGLGILDIATANVVFQKAKEMKIGQELEL